MAINHKFHRMAFLGLTAGLGFAVASCAPSHSLKQVDTRNPTVTYEYRGDSELLQAQSRAAEFCRQYGKGADSGRISSGSGYGVQLVSFECDSELAGNLASGESAESNLTYSYRTDQDLLNASQQAGAYCIERNSDLAVSDLRNNSDGSKTIVFRCD
ncbi:MAG: hypothetical protein WEA84_14265 [Rhodovibrionaceae bacterium]